MKASKRDSRVYLEDILSALLRIEEYGRRGEQEFLTDHLLQDALIRQLSIVGEASAKLPRSLREQHPEIPWKLIVGMRNVIIHDYSEIKPERIWQTVVEDLPLLRRSVDSMLKKAA